MFSGNCGYPSLILQQNLSANFLKVSYNAESKSISMNVL